MHVSVHKLAILLCSLGTVVAADPVAPPAPPLPSELPALAPAQNQPRRVVPVARPQGAVSLPQFQQRAVTNRIAPRPAPVRYQPTYVGDDILKWDASEKELHAKPDDLDLHYAFALTNVSGTNVTINWVRPSCGCTVAKLPATPWKLAPGEGGEIEFNLDIRGKSGTMAKYVSVDTSHGQKLLLIKAVIPQRTVNPSMDARMQNMQKAMADRQVVFRGDCAKCHAEPTVGKKGEELYAAACAICHDAPHRASMVPDLRALKNATGPDYWAFWIANGKPGTLMPGFAKAHGGPLDEEQIRSLADFMFERFPRAEPGGAATATSTNKPVASPTGATGNRPELNGTGQAGAGY